MTRDILTIAALGTSLTARGGWVEALPVALEPVIGFPVRALNFGKSGETSRWGVKIIDTVSREYPDIGLIEFASNDAALHRCMLPGESVHNVTTIVRSLRSASPGIRLYLMTMSPATGIRGLVRPLLGHYYDLYPKLAQRERTGFIDNRPAWKALSREELTRAIPDGAHPIPSFAHSITLKNVAKTIAHDFGQPAPDDARNVADA